MLIHPSSTEKSGGKVFNIDYTWFHAYHCFSRGLYYYTREWYGWSQGGVYVMDNFGNAIKVPDSGWQESING